MLATYVLADYVLVSRSYEFAKGKPGYAGESRKEQPVLLDPESGLASSQVSVAGRSSGE